MKSMTFMGLIRVRWMVFEVGVLWVVGWLGMVEGTAVAAEAAKAWSGTWNNQKFKTTGELTCTVVGEQNGQWIAKFTGTGLGKPFNFTALITVKDNGGAKALQGVAKIQGDNYQWTGSISGQTLTGNFQSGTGNKGDFKLQAKK